MKTQLLLPRFFRPIGYVLAIPGFILGYFVAYQNYSIPGFGFKMRNGDNIFQKSFENFTNELALTLVILGLLFVAFARIKKEDELTARSRLNSLYWAVLTNFAGYTIFAILSFTNMIYHSEAIGWLVDRLSDGDSGIVAYNLFAPLLIFILRFNYLLYKSDGEYENKELRLLPNRPFNMLGKILSVIFLIGAVLDITTNSNAVLEYSMNCLPLALLLWSYAKEKDEDEYVRSLRLDSMQLAIYINYAVLLLSNFLVYGLGFLIIQVYNLATIPLIFQISFQYKLYRLRKEDSRQSSTLSCL